MLKEVEKYMRLDHFPHIWCPGCGHGIIMQSFLRAVLDLGIDQDKLVIASGIGCSSRAVGYMDFDTLHTAHGRAIPFATGIKMAKPELTVAVLTGDGDAAAIGGNHLIHAARRNIDLTVIVFNNFIYGMTGGQYSPLTPTNDIATTAPYGNLEKPFSLCSLVQAAGATFVARSTTYHAIQLPKLFAAGLSHHGFSFIEVITGCHTYHGKMNKLETPIDMLEFQRDHAVNPKQYDTLSDEEKEDKFIIGVLHASEQVEYIDEYNRIIKEAKGENKKGD